MQNTESLFNTLKTAESNLLVEISTQSTLLTDLNQELDKIRQMMNILGSTTKAQQSSTIEKPKVVSRVQRGLAKRDAIKTTGKVTIQDQITNALHSIKSGTKERIINYLLNDKEPLSKENMSKLKHNITVVASNMYNSKKLDIKGKEKRSYIYTLPKVERKIQTV